MEGSVDTNFKEMKRKKLFGTDSTIALVLTSYLSRLENGSTKLDRKQNKRGLLKEQDQRMNLKCS